MVATLLCAFFISFCSAFNLIPLLQKIARNSNALDLPDGVLKQQPVPVPYLGGVAVYLGFLIALLVLLPFESRFFLFFLGITFLLFLGLLDDLVCLRPLHKFLGQLIATFCFLKAGLHLKALFFSCYWRLFISGLWIVSVINAFNFVDVMDGLATLVAILATVTFLIIAFLFRMWAPALLLTSLLGGLIAFFYYNRPPAAIYLGDAGTHFIGGFLAVVPFFFNWGYYSINGYLVAPIILAVPLLELVFLVLIRIQKRLPVYWGSPHHFSLYLARRGWKPVAILYFTAFVSSLASILAIFVAFDYLSSLQIIFICSTVFVLWGFFIFFDKKESLIS